MPHVEAAFLHKVSEAVAPGLSFVHLVNQHVAAPGDQLIFTAWVLNDSSETLTDITLNERSFTNSKMTSLNFQARPTPELATGRVLGPGQTLTFSFSYTVQEDDAVDTGLLISALSVDASSPTLGSLHSQCDALVHIWTSTGTT